MYSYNSIVGNLTAEFPRHVDSILLDLQIHVNGLIKFNEGLSNVYVSDTFPYINPAVAALRSFFNDGRLFYRQTTDPDILQRATNDVADRTGFTATWVFIATWHNVTYYYRDDATPVRTFSLMKTMNKPLIYIIW